MRAAPVIPLIFAALAACERGPQPTAQPSACPSATAAPAASAPATAELPATPWVPAAIAHGGVGSPPEMKDGCRAAVDAALRALESGAEPVDAAVAGVVVLEDDPRYNAGTGSRVRLDGATVQMDASVMTSAGRFAAVAAIEDVKNPVKVARAVMDTPHLVLAGDGATRFARTLGVPVFDPATPAMRARAAELRALLEKGDPSIPDAWKTFDWRARWNFARPFDAGIAPPHAKADAGSDTVGVAVRAKDGRFAVALSTGGTAITLRGRVGDVPILGAGLFAGKYGAAAATGTGERIVEAGLARKAHDALAAGKSPREAAERAVDELRGKDIGIIVIGAKELAASADRPMAWAARASGSTEWQGP